MSLFVLWACTARPPATRIQEASLVTAEGVEAHRVLVEVRGERVAAAWRGAVTLDEQDARPTQLEPGGALVLTQETGVPRRRLSYRRGDDGELSLEYSDGERRVAPDEAARAWEADVITALVARQDLGGVARRARLLRTGGASALLDHLERETAGAFSAEYLDAAALDEEPDGTELCDLVQRAAHLSSGERALARYLVAACARWPSHEELTLEVLRAARTVRSGPAHSEVLGQVVLTRDLTPRVAEQVFADLEGLETSSQRAFVLTAFLSTTADWRRWSSTWRACVERSVAQPQRADLLSALQSRLRE